MQVFVLVWLFHMAGGVLQRTHKGNLHHQQHHSIAGDDEEIEATVGEIVQQRLRERAATKAFMLEVRSGMGDRNNIRRRLEDHVNGGEQLFGLSVETFHGEGDIQVSVTCEPRPVTPTAMKSETLKTVEIGEDTCRLYEIDRYSLTQEHAPLAGYKILAPGATTCEFVPLSTPCATGTDTTTAIVGEKIRRFPSASARDKYCKHYGSFLAHIVGPKAPMAAKTDEVQAALKELDDGVFGRKLAEMESQNAYTHGNKSTLVYVVKFSDEPSWAEPPLTDDKLMDVMKQVSGFIEDSSYGKTRLEPIQIVPTYIDIDLRGSGNCDRAIDRARAAARLLGKDEPATRISPPFLLSVDVNNFESP